jgi:predicted permease
MQNLILIFNMVAPVFLIVAAGYLLKKLGIINDNFIAVSSKVVFTIAIPSLMFSEISTINFNEVFNVNLIIFVYLLTITTFVLSWLFAIPFIKNTKDKGAFIQGSFRGNFAIVGLALILNAFGEGSIAKGSIVLAFTIPLYNVLAVLVLSYFSQENKKTDIRETLVNIVTNPLIIAIIIALPFSYLKIKLHPAVSDAINYIADLTLPLALLSIGGFLDFTEIKNTSSAALLSTILKIVLFPLTGTFAAYLAGYRNDDLGIMFILFGCPTAIASFIMAEAMGSNSRLAGNIVLLTTLGSIITISLGLFILKENGLI